MAAVACHTRLVPGPAPPAEPDAATKVLPDARSDASPRPSQGTSPGEAPPVTVDARPPSRPILLGPPEVVGCADGSREGFRSLQIWPSLAACAGAWQVPGVVGADAAAPRCGRKAGDRGLEPSGAGCGVGDLCAAGWAPCSSPAAVAARSESGCRGVTDDSAAEPVLFIVAAGANASGACLTDPSLANDLHGCGDLGEPEDGTCAPLDRRLTFADCAQTGGVWLCGSADRHLDEAALALKPQARLGGVLCCRP